MTDLQTQIRAYAEQLDTAAPALVDLAAWSPEPRPRRRRPVPAVVAVGVAAVIAVVSVGAVLLLGRSQPDVAAPMTSRPTVAPVVPVVAFRLLTPNPVFTSGKEGNTLGYPHAGPGAVAVADGIFHALRSGGDDENSAVLYSWSADGVAWETAPEPAITAEDVPWPVSVVTVGSLLRGSDGVWLAYFFTSRDTGGHGDHFFEQRIGRATAPNPSGPWSIDSAPVLVPGVSGSWDDYNLKYPSVVEGDVGYVLYYAGGTKEGPGAIGRATSVDGIAWTKDPAPALTGLAAPSWEDGGLNRPGVLRTNDGWAMTFSRRTGGVRGMAFSDDGLSWERHPGNPVLDTAALPRGALFMSSLVERDGDYFWFIQAGGSRTGSETYVMIHEGPLW